MFVAFVSVSRRREYECARQSQHSWTLTASETPSATTPFASRFTNLVYMHTYLHTSTCKRHPENQNSWFELHAHTSCGWCQRKGPCTFCKVRSSRALQLVFLLRCFAAEVLQGREGCFRTMLYASLGTPQGSDGCVGVPARAAVFVG